MKDVFLALLPEDILEIRAIGINPEFNHPPRRVKTAGNIAAALAFTDVPDIHHNDVRIVQHANKIRRLNLLNAGAGVLNHLGCGDFERHLNSLRSGGIWHDLFKNCHG